MWSNRWIYHSLTHTHCTPLAWLSPASQAVGMNLKRCVFILSLRFATTSNLLFPSKELQFFVSSSGRFWGLFQETVLRSNCRSCPEPPEIAEFCTLWTSVLTWILSDGFLRTPSLMIVLHPLSWSKELFYAMFLFKKNYLLSQISGFFVAQILSIPSKTFTKRALSKDHIRVLFFFQVDGN